MKLRFQVLLTTASKTTKHISVFLLGVIMARMLPVETYGTYLQVQLVVNTVLYAAIFGVPHSIYYFLPQVRMRRRFLALTAMMMMAVATVVSIAIYFLTPWLSLKLNNADLSSFAIVIALLILLQVPIKIFEPTMITAKRVPIFVVVNMTFNVALFFVVLVPLLLQYSLADLFQVLVIFHVIQFATIGFALAYASRTIVDNPDGNDHSISKQLKYSLPIGFSGTIGEVARQIDKIIISMLFNPYQFAVYSRGALQIPLLNVISHSLHNILMPNFVAAYQNNDIPELLRVWHSAMRMMALIVYPTFAFFVVTADIFIPTLFSDKYAEASIIFQIYIFTLLRRITSGDSIIRAVGRTGVLLKITIFSVFLNIGLTYALVKQFGTVGAPVGTVVTTYLVFAYYLRVVGKLLDVPIRKIVPWRSLLQLLTISGIAIALASLLRLLDLQRSTTLMLIFFAFSIIYWLLLRRSNILSEYERSALRGVLPRRLRWAI